MSESEMGIMSRQVRIAFERPSIRSRVEERLGEGSGRGAVRVVPGIPSSIVAGAARS